MTVRSIAQAAAGNVAPPPSIFDISTATLAASPLNFLFVGDRDTSPSGIFFKPDGTKLYMIGTVQDRIHEFDLSTAWDIKTASYNQLSNSLGPQDSNPQGLFFKSDGTKVYVVGSTNDKVYEYNLSTAWDISTLSYSSNSFSVVSQDNTPSGVFFKPDGTVMYVIGYGSDAVYQYTLSTAWDVSTASYASKSFSVLTQDGIPLDVTFKSDGTKFYIAGNVNDAIYEYTLSTAWDVSTASYSNSFSLNNFDTTPTGITFKSDGSTVYFVGSSTDYIYQFDLSTAWDITTASFTEPTSDYYKFNNSTFGFGYGFFIKNNGYTLYYLSDTNKTVYEFSLSTPWDITTASYTSNSFATGITYSHKGFTFKPDGTVFYIVTANNDEVHQFDLSTAWDITTASYTQSFSVTSQEGFPTTVKFNTDGDKMYIIGTTNDTIYQYTLSTAWDISTASYASKSFYTGVSTPNDIYFPSGEQVIVVETGVDVINDYRLSTEWDISTASLYQSLDVSDLFPTPTKIFFKPDGTKMFLYDLLQKTIYGFDL